MTTLGRTCRGERRGYSLKSLEWYTIAPPLQDQAGSPAVEVLSKIAIIDRHGASKSCEAKNEELVPSSGSAKVGAATIRKRVGATQKMDV